ncbi:hypothetical protein SPSPH_018390 [Sporomusa sphaeroides DSM 2875]|uniref:Inhibitor of sigma-G Gin n=1 Tax=Sporomusa sphaeroides DSM 2875 TaxID=1337886 RepID=A0ABP2C5Z3_9FIRM|nr:hypothetical protein SPSPH_18060 [Sporomusa sphaeroides DSM 2875]CVK17543.1 hypothetical protein SSPH_00177 [Sporomusa sphaeroides DSM 2875]
MLTSGVILCLQCKSSHVDILHWTGQGAVTQCANCGCQGFIACLSIGRVELHNEQINKAQRDMALPTCGRVG